MAFIRSVSHSSYWIAVFVDELGKKTNRSTKLKAKEANRKAALQMAFEWESAVKVARAGELTAAVASKTLSKMVKQSTGEQFSDLSLEQYLADWLKGRLAKVSTASINRYSPVLERFKTFMGHRAKKSLAGVTPADVEKFHRYLLKNGQSATTANFGVKILRGAFRMAHIRGQIPINPAASVELMDDDSQEKHPFSIEQVRELLKVANADWKGMILLGALAGFRLADAANLTWGAVNAEEGTLEFLPSKTARRRKGVPMIVAAHPAILNCLLSRESADRKPDSPIFPALKGRRSGNWGGLSNAFGRIMKAAGIVSAPTRQSRPGGRAFHPLSFHSLRHHFVSELLNRSVPADVRKMMAGHSCDRAHSRYAHLSIETQKRAVEAHPGF